MPKFKRKTKPKPDVWIFSVNDDPVPGDADYDFMRPDRRKIPPPTPAECATARLHITTNMLKAFGRKPWMSGIIWPEETDTGGDTI